MIQDADAIHADENPHAPSPIESYCCSFHFPVAELTTFVYLVEGEPSTGTVNELARAMEQATYNGMEVGDRIWTFEAGEPVQGVVRTFSTGFNEDDYARVTVEIQFPRGAVESATYRVDGRA